VGIAASDGLRPEGILSRVRKHRVKATGSHVGVSENVTGGVHHPTKWRDFAISRAMYFVESNHEDTCKDMQIIIAKIDATIEQPRDALAIFEALLCQNVNEIKNIICGLIWPSVDQVSVNLLTDGHDKLRVPMSVKVVLWDQSIYCINS
jgi:hypothetical protein